MAKKKRGNSINVDFTGVEAGSVKLPDGGYRLKVVSATHKENDGDGAIVTKLEVTGADSKKYIGKTLTVYFNLGETSLWVLRNFLDAVGVEVPDGPLDIDLDGLVDLEFEATAYEHEYDGKTSTRLKDFIGADEDDAPKGKGKKGKDEDEEEVEVSDRKKKRSRDEDEEEDETKSRKKKSRKDEDEDEEETKSKKKSKRDEDEDEEEETKSKKKSRKDEDEEEEKPAKKKSKSVKYTEDEVRDMDEDELEDLIDKHDLEIDGYKKLANIRKKAMAVVDALTDADLIED